MSFALIKRKGILSGERVDYLVTTPLAHGDHVRLFNQVKALLPSADINIMIAASKTLGNIAGLSSNAFGGERFVDLDFEVQTAIELLAADKQDPARYAGVLMLKELAKNNSIQFHPHIGLVLDSILAPLRDPRIIVREGAAELLAACLDILVQRERQTDNPHLVSVWQNAQAGLKMSAPEVIHGSLLTYKELLLYGGMVRPLLAARDLTDNLEAPVHEEPLRRHGRADNEVSHSPRSERTQDGNLAHTGAGGLRYGYFH